MLVGVEGLGEDLVPGEDHDDGKVLIDEGKNTVLELARHDGLAVQIRDLLDLEGTLEGGGELAATAKEEQALLVLEELGAHVLDRIVELEDLADLLRHLGKTLDDLLATALLGSTVLAEREGEHDHGDELGSVGLGGGDTNLGAGVDVDTAVGEQRNRRAHNVDDADGQGTALETVAESAEGVGSLAGLRHKHAGVVTEDGSLSVEEVGGKLDGDRDLSQLLKDTADGHARVVAGAAGDEDDATAATDRGDVLSQTAESDLFVDNVQATAHGVDDGLGLLEDFLLHEVVKVALHDLLELELDGLDGTDVGGAIVLVQTVNVELALVDVGNVVVLEVQHLFGVLDNGGRVGGEEEFGGLGDAVVGQESAGLRAVQEGLVRGSQEGRRLLEGRVLGSLLSGEGTVLGVLDVDKVDLHLLGSAHTNDQGRALAGGNDLMGIVDRLEQQTKSALELADDGLGEGGEVDVGVQAVEVLCELCDALGVGFGLEAVALALEEGLELLVVCDDAVVDDGELPLGVGSRPDGKFQKYSKRRNTAKGETWAMAYL